VRPYLARARAFRRELSLPEVLLWTELRGGRLDGLKFRRQHPAGPYVLDFYCPSARLAVEIDGRAHETEDRPIKDAIRDIWLAERGVRTLRIAASEVLRSVDDTIGTIREAIRPWSLDPPPEGGGVGEADGGGSWPAWDHFPLRRYAPPPPLGGGSRDS
jgi:very-short-patch-repair endonuclease